MTDPPARSSSPLRAFQFEAIASGFVAALALAVSTYNVYLQREQVRAQVWPHLEWMYSESYGAEPEFKWTLANTGVGPAIVRAVRIRVGGTPTKTWEGAFKLMSDTDPEIAHLLAARTGYTHSTIAERVLGAGVEMTPMSLHGLGAEFQGALRRTFKKVDVDICYCSTLGECWLVPDNKSVSACPTDGFVFTD